MTAALPRYATQHAAAEAMALFYVWADGLIVRGPGMDWATTEAEVKATWGEGAWKRMRKQAWELAHARLVSDGVAPV